ncbi:MAG: response regulator transcription factor [Eubacteriales bacterium]
MSQTHTVLVVEDEHNIASFMTTVLTANEFHVLKAKTGAEALALNASYNPDVILLDLGLPDIDGQKVIKSIRESSDVPIIVLTARTHERDKVAALDLGADDYVTKPFGTSELLARIRTALRHAKNRGRKDSALQIGIYRAKGLTINYEKRRAYVDGKDIHLTQTEYNIVSLLSHYAGRVLTYDYIIRNIWGPLVGNDNQILRVNMANIRRKLEKNPAEPEYIFTEMGVGYRMLESD